MRSARPRRTRGLTHQVHTLRRVSWRVLGTSPRFHYAITPRSAHIAKVRPSASCRGRNLRAPPGFDEPRLQAADRIFEIGLPFRSDHDLTLE